MIKDLFRRLARSWGRKERKADSKAKKRRLRVISNEEYELDRAKKYLDKLPRDA